MTFACAPRNEGRAPTSTTATISAGPIRPLPSASVSASASVAAPVPALEVEPPNDVVCTLAGTPDAALDTDAMGMFRLRVTPSGETFAWLVWDDTVTIRHQFPRGKAMGSFVTASGGGVEVHGYEKAPVLYAKGPTTFVAGLDVSGTHPLEVIAADETGQLSLTLQVPFQTTSAIESVRKCKDLNAQPSSFELPPIPGYLRPIGTRKLAEDEELWIQTPELLVVVTGPTDLPVFARRNKQERVMFTFGSGRLYGWTTPPQQLLGLVGGAGAGAMGLAHSSTTRSCKADLRLFARLDTGQFAHVGTVRARTPMMMFSSDDDPRYERVGFRHSWLGAGRFYVRKDERAACPE